MSTYSYIACGVPQGSVLCPLLFLLYLTGLRDIIEPFSIEYMLYADDLQLYLSFPVRDLPSAVIKMQECFQAVKTWLSTLYLVVNDKKTECILLGSAQLINNVTSPTSSLEAALFLYPHL
jgi:hypothetical protein